MPATARFTAPHSGGGPDGSGTVFSLDLQTDAESVLTSSMISLPATPVLLAHDVLYGTTTAGDNGQGTIYAFDLKTTATTTLYAFPRGRDQAYPSGVIKIGGSLYGATNNGGDYDDGSIFAFDLKSGVLTTLYSFTGGADGAHPLQGGERQRCPLRCCLQGWRERLGRHFQAGHRFGRRDGPL